MLKIMLCGVDNIKEYSNDFVNVTKEFGGESSFYQDSVHYTLEARLIILFIVILCLFLQR